MPTQDARGSVPAAAVGRDGIVDAVADPASHQRTIVIRAVDPDAPADLLGLAVLREAWTAEQHGDPDAFVRDPTFVERFVDWYRAGQATRRSWLAEVDGQPIGMVSLHVYERMPRPGSSSGAWGYLGAAYVRPEHRDAGVGGRLLDALTTWAWEEGLLRVVLNPSERAVPFYRRAGFREPPGLLQLDPPDPSPATDEPEC